MADIIPYQGEDCNIMLQQEDPAYIDAAFLATWLHGKSEKTQRAYTSDMQRFYRFVGKPLPLVTLPDLQAYADSLADLKPASRNRALAAVKSALSFGVKMSPNYLKVNVGLLVKLEQPEDTLAERIMSEQAVARMLALESNPRNHAILSK